jgi:branched-chain amino acid transport system substrate-binding protein
MKKTTKIWCCISIVAVVAIAVVLIVLQPWKPKQPEVIKIGAILPLTGDGAVFGEECKQGILLAVKNFALDNPKSTKYEIVFEDSKGKPEEAIGAYWVVDEHVFCVNCTTRFEGRV